MRHPSEVSSAPGPGASALEAHLGYWLRLVSNHVSGAFAKALDARQVSVAEWVVLCEIHEHAGIRPSQLAERIGLTRGAISKILDKLERRFWIARKTVEADNRNQQISLTPAGRRALPPLVAIADRNDRRFFECLNPPEQAALRSLLGKLASTHAIRNLPVE